MTRSFITPLPKKKMDYPDAIIVYYTQEADLGDVKRIYRYEGKPDGLFMQRKSQILHFEEIWYE